MNRIYKHNRSLTDYSRINRKQQTETEKLLWFHLRGNRLKGYKFRRQFPFQNYILDFYCPEKNIAIELDGSQHIQQSSYDTKRTEILNNAEITVLRFWDNDVLQHINEVLNQILEHLDKTTSP